MSNLLKKQIQYTVACISEFAQSKSLTKKQAFMYLLEYKALAFLEEFYDVEHTLWFKNIDCSKIIFSLFKIQYPLYNNSISLIQQNSNLLHPIQYLSSEKTQAILKNYFHFYEKKLDGFLWGYYINCREH